MFMLFSSAVFILFSLRLQYFKLLSFSACLCCLLCFGKLWVMLRCMVFCWRFLECCPYCPVQQVIIPLLCHHIDVLEVASQLIVVQAVAYDEIVWNLHGTVFDINVYSPFVWL